MTAPTDPTRATPPADVPLTAINAWYQRMFLLADDVEMGGLTHRAIANAVRALAADVRSVHQRAQAAGRDAAS